MDDLDFTGLRADLETAVVLPEFDEVARRARRRRTRGRLATAAALMGVLGILGPTGVLAASQGGGVSPVSVPVSPTEVQVGPPTLPARVSPSNGGVPRATVVAADGADLKHVYALVDVCVGQSCNLQLSRVGATDGTGPARVGLLRAESTDWLSGYELTALSDDVLMVSAVVDGGQRTFLRIDLGASPNPRQSSTPRYARPGDRIAVTDEAGDLTALDAATGEYRSLPTRPLLDDIKVAGSVPAAAGLWLTGTDPLTGNVAAAVSRDAGANWTVSPIAVTLGSDPPVLATHDGKTGYLLVRTSDRVMRMYRTINGGRSWAPVPVALPWPTDPNADYGMVVRPDGALLAWLATSPTTVYALSVDGGQTFTNVPGPGGPVMALPDGYVTLSATPRLSRDCVNWADTALPYLPITN